MILLAETSRTTTATPEAVFALWADVDHWHEFDEGIEWARLAGPCEQGAGLTLKPRGGPKVRATIVTLEPCSEFVDVSRLPGARLRFTHRISQDDGSTLVTVTMTLTGPLRWVWSKILGADQQADLDASTTRLLERAETQTTHA